MLIGQYGKNAVIYGVDNSLPCHIDNIKEDFLFLGKGPADDLDDPTVTAEIKYSLNITKPKKKICLSFQYNCPNIFCKLMAWGSIYSMWKTEIKPSS